MGLARAVLVIAGGNVASRTLGFLREIVIAALFGATAATDAFRAASRIPTSIYDLLVGGLISAALVPVLSEYADNEDQEQFWAIASILTNLVAAILIPLSALLIVSANWLIDIYATGLDPATSQIATTMVRVMLPALVFQGLAGLLTSMHYARRQFTYPAMSISAFNLGIIVMALVLSGPLGPISLVIGVLAGAVGQAALLLVTLRGFRYRLRLDLRHPAVRRIILLAAPVAGGLCIDIAARLVDTRLATSTGEGNLAALVFATTIVQLPLGLIASAVSQAILPTLSRYAQPVSATNTPLEAEESIPLTEQTNDQQFRSTLGLGIQLVLIAIVPATILLVILRFPVVQILFERGNFDLIASDKTALAFLAYAPGLPAAAIDQILMYAFYARRNTLTPVLVGVVSIGIYLVFAVLLIEPLGFAGLALANSLQWIGHAIILAFLLHRNLGNLRGLNLGSTPAKVLLAGGAMAAVLWLLSSALGLTAHSALGPLPLLGLTAAAGGISLALYAAILVALRVPQLGRARALVAGRLRR